MKPRRNNLAGNKYGRLTAISVDHISTGGSAYWRCLCECGNHKIVKASHLKSGAVKSCGCLAREASSKTAKEHLAGRYCARTHGCTNTRLFRIWMAMRRRCSYVKAINYSRYGGRGITVCKEWEESFDSFKNWALSNGYSDNLSIDRINNNGIYEPNNCRWSIATVQGNNRSSCHYITFNGETLTVVEWEAKLRFPRNLIAQRLHRGWSEEKALTTKKGEYVCHKI